MPANVIFNLMNEFVASSVFSLCPLLVGPLGLNFIWVRCTAVSAASCPAPDTLPVLVNTQSYPYSREISTILKILVFGHVSMIWIVGYINLYLVSYKWNFKKYKAPESKTLKTFLSSNANLRDLFKHHSHVRLWMIMHFNPKIIIHTYII